MVGGGSDVMVGGGSEVLMAGGVLKADDDPWI